MLTVYGLTTCSTVKKALAALAAGKVPHRFHDVRAETPTRAQLEGWSRQLGGWEKLLNRGSFTWRGLPEAERQGLTEATAIALALKHPALIRHPLIERPDGTVTTGFARKVQEELLK